MMEESQLADIPKLQTNIFYKTTKKILDLLMASFGIILLSPILMTVAVVIKFTSPGPVIYQGLRTGLKGKTFRIYKFRTMRINADKGAGTTSRNDPRITPIGKSLRKYKIDELPQLFNVLFGDMSFVGPRPELPYYTDQYKDEELIILAVRPGITDYSSILFSNLNDLIDDKDPDSSFENNILAKKNQLRIQYVKDRGILLDLKLIFKTIFKIFLRK